MVLCVSVLEYTAPVWKNSCHKKQIIVPNHNVRIVNGYLKPTKVEKYIRLRNFWNKMIADNIDGDSDRHLLNDHTAPINRQKSRKSFASTISIPMEQTVENHNRN